ncbi:MAG: WGR domain-containing protein [Cytophagia bacterium]|nr:WGR domain-containing protein [Cytophagia bacterium]
MKHYLTLENEKSAKFWQIEIIGKSFTVIYGKMGSAGVSQTKTFTNEDQCKKEAEKLLKGKLQKGYGRMTDPVVEKETGKREVVKSKLTGTKRWSEITDAKNLENAVLKHFSFLCDCPGFEPILKAVMKNPQQAQVKENKLVISYQNFQIIADEPISNKVKCPKSLMSILNQHGQISIERENETQINLGLHSRLDFGLYDEGDSLYELFGGDDKKAIGFMVDKFRIDRFWLYHPTHKNQFGEPAAFPISHEREDEIDIVEYNAGSLFLICAAEMLKLSIKIPKFKGSAKETAEMNSSFNEPWAEALTKRFKTLDAKKILAEYDNTIAIKGAGVTDLSGLQVLAVEAEKLGKKIRLERVNLADTKVADISSLSQFKSLYSVDISGTRVRDVSSLKHISFLIADRCLNLDFKTLSELTSIRKLFLRDTNMNDLSVLFRLKKLEELHVLGTKFSDLDIKGFKKQFEKQVRAPLQIDVRPDITDPNMRAFQENKNYRANIAVRAGDQLLSNPANMNGKFLKQLWEEADAQGFQYYNEKDDANWKLFTDFKERVSLQRRRLEYKTKFKDKTILCSKKDVSNLSKMVVDLVLHFFTKAHYQCFSEYKLQDDSEGYYHVSLLTYTIAATRFMDITENEVRKIIVDSGKIKYSKEGKDMYVKLW